jgi:hypothetical protein
METYLKLFNNLLDHDGKMAFGIIYDKSLTDHHDNAYAYLRYRLTDITIQLVCFCGVYINNEDEYLLLKEMLNSWKYQYLPITLYLSISQNTNINLNIDLEIYNDSEKLHILFSDEKLSQFEHYKNIINNNKINSSSWIIFTNFNDVWGRQRSCAYNTLINLYNTTKFKDKKPIYIKYNYENADINHNQYCCKYEDFTNFILKIDNEILNNRICGLYFIKYLNLNDETHLSLPNKDLYDIIIKNTSRENFVSMNLKEMFIFYFSKQKNFTVDDFKNFWNYHMTTVPFDAVKKNCLELYNSEMEFFKKYEHSVIYK